MYLACNHLTMKYENTLALDDVSFQVDAGDYLCILGANGSGKSTLLKAILGLLPVKNGSVIYGDGIKSSEIGYLPRRPAVRGRHGQWRADGHRERGGCGRIVLRAGGAQAGRGGAGSGGLLHKLGAGMAQPRNRGLSDHDAHSGCARALKAARQHSASEYR